MLDELAEDDQVAPAAPAGLGELDRGTHDRLDDRGDVVVGRVLATSSSSPSRWARNGGVLLQHRDEQAVAAAEVVVHRAPVALPGTAGDLDQRRRRHALLGEGAGRRVDQPAPGLLSWPPVHCRAEGRP